MDRNSDFGAKLELFFGAASDALAHVYARLHGVVPEAGLRLTGSLVGPKCRYAQTLPAQFSFVDRGAGPTLLAEALVPEPCFWTPEMPHLYQATLELRRGEQVIAKCTRDFGIRTLGIAGTSLNYDGKRWVLRGMRSDQLPSIELGELRACDAALLVDHPVEPLCREASQLGVLLIAQLSTPDAGELARLARWPAVAIVVLPAGCMLDPAGLPPNMLLAARVPWGTSDDIPTWAQIAMFDIDEKHPPQRIPGKKLPLIAIRKFDGMYRSAAEGRVLCDRLQRELAGCDELAGLDFAGYIV